MTYGVQIFDEDGHTLLDTSQRAGRFIGSVETNGLNGSIVVPEFSQGTPFVVVLDNNSTITDIYTFRPWLPLVTISGTTLSWNYDGAGASYRANSNIVYGVY